MFLVDQNIPFHKCHYGRHDQYRRAALVVPSIADGLGGVKGCGIPPRHIVLRDFFDGQAGRNLDLDITLTLWDAAGWPHARNANGYKLGFRHL